MFDANRHQTLSNHTELIKNNLHVAKSFVFDRMDLPNERTAEGLQPGEGRVVRHDGRTVAVCRTTDGQHHHVAAACTHMGCIVAWNDAETSWDCPCHGSRFGLDGDVLTGPGTRCLEEADDSVRPS